MRTKLGLLQVGARFILDKHPNCIYEVIAEYNAHLTRVQVKYTLTKGAWISVKMFPALLENSEDVLVVGIANNNQ